MASNIQIPLQVQTPQPASPLATIAGLMQLRGQLSEMALRNAQVEQAKQQTQNIQAEQVQKNRDLSDQNILSEHGKTHPEIYGGDFSSLSGIGLQPKTIDAFRASVDAALDKEVARTSTEQKQRKQASENLGKFVSSLSQMRNNSDNLDIPRVNEALQQGLISHASDLKIIGFNPDQLQKSMVVSKEQDLQDVASRMRSLDSFIGAGISRKKEQADTAAKSAEASKNSAAAAIDNFKLNLMNGMDANGVASAVDSLIDPAKYPQANKDAHAAAAVARLSGDPAEVSKAVKSIYDEQVGKPAGAAATVKAETPAKIEQANALIPSEVNKSVATARAIAPIEADKAVQTQTALAKASPDAFAGIINPAARNEVQTQWSKAYGDTAAALNQSQQLLDTIAQERAGNKAAASAITVDQARSLISNSRAMGPVMHQVSAGSGNLIDKLEGQLKGIAGTDKLPSDVVKGIEDLSKVQRDAALRQYDSALVPLQARGADVSKLPRPAVASASAGYKPGDTRVINGTTYKRDDKGNWTPQ